MQNNPFRINRIIFIRVNLIFILSLVGNIYCFAYPADIYPYMHSEHLHREVISSLRAVKDDLLNKNSQLQKLIQQLQAAQSSIQEKDNHINQLNSQLAQLQAEIRSYREFLTSLKHDSFAKDSQLQQLTQQLQALKQQQADKLSQNENEIQLKDFYLAEIQERAHQAVGFCKEESQGFIQQLQAVQSSVQEKDSQISQLNKQLAKLQEKDRPYKERLASLKDETLAKDNQLQQLTQRLKATQYSVQEKDSQISKLNKQLELMALLKRESSDKDNQLQQFSQEFSTFKQQAAAKLAQNENEVQLKDSKKSVSSKEELEGFIQELQASRKAQETKLSKEEKAIVLRDDKFAGNREYVIKPGDTLSITVWKHSDLDHKVIVDTEGKISLPLTGDIQAAGLTLNALREVIVSALSKGYIVSPYVTVEVEGKTIFIYGEIKNPGSYPLAAQMTVLKAVTAAGGLTDFASSAVNIKRKYDSKEYTFRVNLGRITNHIQEDIILQPDDILIVRRRIF